MASRVTYESGALKAYIGGLPKKADALAGKIAAQIEAEAKQNAPVDTGAMRASVAARREAAAVWLVTVGVAYAVYVEFGTYKMAPRPWFYPAVLRAANQLASLARVELNP